jgi:hypothetical protein
MRRHGAIVGTILISLLVTVIFEGQPDANDANVALPHENQDHSLDTVSLMQGKHLYVEFSNSTSSTVRKNSFSRVAVAAGKHLIKGSRRAADALHAVFTEHSRGILGQLQSTHLSASLAGAFFPIFLLFLGVGFLTCALFFILQGKDEINLRHPGDLSWRSDQRWSMQHELDRGYQPSFHDLSARAYNNSQVRLTPPVGAPSPAGTWATLPRAAGSAVSTANPVAASEASLGLQANLGLRSLPLVPGHNPAAASDQANLFPFLLSRGASQENRVLPPPLCPSLVLPVCEARFGVPIKELSSLTPECDMGIVGMSQNTLLRAAVKKVGSYQRVLEIGMPEPHSAPRATVGPAAPGAKSLEIRGLKGAYYGMLEMRTNGACYVVKDSTTVLSIDGNTNSLKLQICSGTGSELASVRCSSEPFGGVDHVEVRVEPGVDTILVLACVLAVLLLSPYPPDYSPNGYAPSGYPPSSYPSHG